MSHIERLIAQAKEWDDAMLELYGHEVKFELPEPPAEKVKLNEEYGSIL